MLIIYHIDGGPEAARRLYSASKVQPERRSSPLPPRIAVVNVLEKSPMIGKKTANFLPWSAAGGFVVP